MDTLCRKSPTTGTTGGTYYSIGHPEEQPGGAPTSSPRYAVVDLGATDTFVPMSYKGTNEQLVSNGIQVQCANKTQFSSEATDTLDTPTLPTEMRGCHKFADDAMAEPLFAVEKVTKAQGKNKTSNQNHPTI